MSKVLAKTIHLGLGLDLLGAKTSLSANRGTELEVTPLGVKANSGKNERVILIPWANIKGCELFPEVQPEMIKNLEEVPSQEPRKAGRPKGS